MKAAAAAAPRKKTRRMDVRQIQFTQSTVLPAFSDGNKVDDAAADIRAGRVDIASFPAIRVVKYEGKYYSLDNRRLVAFKRALKGKRDQAVEVQVMRPSDHLTEHKTVLNDLARKFTTKQPSDIRVKDGLPTWHLRVGDKGGHYIYDQHSRKVYVADLSEKAILAIAQKDPAMARRIRLARK